MFPVLQAHRTASVKKKKEKKNPEMSLSFRLIPLTIQVNDKLSVLITPD